MPTYAIYNNRLIESKDIYKFDIDKQSKFSCFVCDKRLQFRQSRNGDKKYTDHFFHPNTKKGVHIECEKPINQIKDIDNKWHNVLSYSLVDEFREYVKRNNTSNKKHIVDGYDPNMNLGIEFQHSKISIEDIQSREETTDLDWIFDVEKQFVRKVNVGNFAICEIPHNNWENAVKECDGNVFLYTGLNEWIWLIDRKNYHIEIEEKKRNVWFGDICSFQDVLDNTCLCNTMKQEKQQEFLDIRNSMDSVNIVYGRCKKSMTTLDKFHRDYVKCHIFRQNEIMAIKSVAGSGKTTTLLELAKIHNTKRILYIAFNRCLINDIRKKINQQNIKNLFPNTFDALMRNVYIKHEGREPNIIDMRPQTISQAMSWFKRKPYNVRKMYAKYYTKFCNQLEYDDITDYCDSILGEKKNLLVSMWKRTLCNQFHTFDSIRKIAQLNHWCKGYIDDKYDMIFIDEAQDFDGIMLKILLEDTNLPKIFVGDTRQAIYEWRGSINAFDKLPNSALMIEFYSTFRIGEPACEQIRKKFKDCWMISKSKNTTTLDHNVKPQGNYIYLFRSWRYLLQTAQNIPHIWIYNYDKQQETIRKLHRALQITDLNKEDKEEFSDDLPAFLIKLSCSELEELLENIDVNLVSKKDSRCQMYTIHSYKGMENNIIRICNDIDIKEEENIYYVALTRGIQQIILDNTNIDDILN